MSLSVSRKNVADSSALGNRQDALHISQAIWPRASREVRAEKPFLKRSARCERSSSAFERRLCRAMLKSMGDPPISLVLCDGEEIVSSDARPVASIIIRDRPALRRLVFDPEFQFGEAYSQGRLEVEGDLRRLLEIFYRTRRHADAGSHPLRKILVRLLHSRRSNSIAAARENIYRHYDVGNDFYQLWLDPQMIYSCAYFARNDMTLAEAQLAKLDYVCRKLCLRPGETVLDVGGGWGGLAIHMARRFGVFVKAFNISRRQIDFARRRAGPRDLTAAWNSSRTITATYPGDLTPWFRWACWNTWAENTIAISGAWPTAALPRTGAD